MATVSAAELRVGDTVEVQMGHNVEVQMGHNHVHSRKGSTHRMWSTRLWTITKVEQGATIKVRGVAGGGIEGDAEFYHENRVLLRERG